MSSVKELVAPVELSMEAIPTRVETISTAVSDTGKTVLIQDEQSTVERFQPLPDQTPKEMFERLYEIGTYVWPTGTPATLAAPFQVLTPYQSILSANPLFAAVLQYFTYIRAGVEIQIRLNTNNFFAGALMITASPGQGTTETMGFVQARSWLKPTVISASRQESTVLTYPWPFPYRYLSIPSLVTGSDFVGWQVYVDILAALTSINPSAPSSVSIVVFARLVDVELVLPASFASPLSLKETKQEEKKQAVVRQSKSTTTTLRQPKVVSSLLHTKPSFMDPVESATGSLASALPALVTKVTGAGEGLAEAFQPILSALGSFPGLFDRPETSLPITRVQQRSQSNFGPSDIEDPAISLAETHDGYVNVKEPSLMEGGPWTFARIGQRPALSSANVFTGPTPSAVQVPIYGDGTPHTFMIQSFGLWRGSMKMKFMFFCSSFVSCRFALIIQPFGAAVNPTITNNTSMVVDVRGDTVVEFTVPYMHTSDWITEGVAFHNILVVPLTTMISTTTTVNPTIAMIVFSAAAEDVQYAAFQQAFGCSYGYPNVSPAPAIPLDFQLVGPVVRQSNICSDFERPFEGFLKGAQMYVDNNRCVSNSALKVVDYMKKYQTVTLLAVPPTGNLLVPNVLTGDANTFNLVFGKMFAFFRGGFKMKYVMNASEGPRTTLSTTLAIAQQKPLGQPFYMDSGAPFVAEQSIALPYYNSIPFTNRLMTATYPFQYNTYDGDNVISSAYMAVRDDFELGFLLPPPSSAAPQSAAVLSGLLKRVALR